MITKIEERKNGAGDKITEQKYNHLAPAEIMKEDNYNKIDGIIDTSTKHSFADRMKAAKNKAKEHNNRKSERHKKAKQDRKTERHKDERH